jgi:hypothetical protein
LIEEGFTHVISYLRKSDEYVNRLAAVQKSMRMVGLHKGIARGFEACTNGVKLRR